jgi:putative AlgH/UPF0301 family transcriptional regulator
VTSHEPPRSWIPRSSRRDSRWRLAASFAFALAPLLGPTVAVAGPSTVNAKPFFLVASRNMADPVFQQSVILMLPSDEPPLVAGIIINKPTDVTLGSLFKQPLASANRNEKVYFGGPVDIAEPILVLRAKQPPKSALSLSGDVYAIADAGSIVDILRAGRGSDARLFVGRAQWAQEQLRGELLEGAWNVVPVRTDLIFEHDSAKIWPMLSQHEHVREISARCCETAGLLEAMLCGGLCAW